MHSNTNTEKMRSSRPRRGWDAEAQAKRQKAKQMQKARRDGAARRKAAWGLADREI